MTTRKVGYKKVHVGRKTLKKNFSSQSLSNPLSEQTLKRRDCLTLAYRRLQVGMQEDVSIGVYGKVVAVWSELQRDKKS